MVPPRSGERGILGCAELAEVRHTHGADSGKYGAGPAPEGTPRAPTWRPGRGPSAQARGTRPRSTRRAARHRRRPLRASRRGPPRALARGGPTGARGACGPRQAEQASALRGRCPCGPAARAGSTERAAVGRGSLAPPARSRHAFPTARDDRPTNPRAGVFWAVGDASRCSVPASAARSGCASAWPCGVWPGPSLVPSPSPASAGPAGPRPVRWSPPWQSSISAASYGASGRGHTTNPVEMYHRTNPSVAVRSVRLTRTAATGDAAVGTRVDRRPSVRGGSRVGVWQGVPSRGCVDRISQCLRTGPPR